MSNIKEHTERVSGLGGEYFKNFVRNIGNPVKPDQISLDLLCGDERKSCLVTPTDGDTTLCLRYKCLEGAVLSMGVDEAYKELSVLQLQGARSKVSFRVATGIKWVEVFGDQVVSIATYNCGQFERLTMPDLGEIKGLYECQSERSVERYKYLANIMHLRQSVDEKRYVRELKETRIFAVGLV
jgi:hypothetical protein